jgi:uncharacterized protein (UPF0276 family)
MIERDDNIPELSVLEAELFKAYQIQEAQLGSRDIETNPQAP